MKTDLPAWAQNSSFDIVHAPASLRRYAKQVLRMAPTRYASQRGPDAELDLVFYVWNSRRVERVENIDLNLWEQGR